MTMAEELGLQHDVLNAEEETELARIIICAKNATRLLMERRVSPEQFEKLQQDAQLARQKLTLQNRRFIFKIAKQYQPRPPITIEDLISEGSIGLLRAIENYDPKQGRLSTYAGYYINQAILTFLIYQNATITVPPWIMEEINAVRTAKAELLEELEQDPTIEEIAERSGRTVKRVKSVMDAIKCRYTPMASLHPMVDDAPLQIADPSSENPHENLVKDDLPNWLTNRLDEVLDERSAKIVRLYYGIGHGESKTLREVGEICGLTRERIRQIVKDATDKLRECIEGELQ